MKTADNITITDSTASSIGLPVGSSVDSGLAKLSELKHKIGDLKFTENPNYSDDWLPSNGEYYDMQKYPDAYQVIDPYCFNHTQKLSFYNNGIVFADWHDGYLAGISKISGNVITIKYLQPLGENVWHTKTVTLPYTQKTSVKFFGHVCNEWVILYTYPDANAAERYPFYSYAATYSSNLLSSSWGTCTYYMHTRDPIMTKPCVTADKTGVFFIGNQSASVKETCTLFEYTSRDGTNIIYNHSAISGEQIVAADRRGTRWVFMTLTGKVYSGPYGNFTFAADFSSDISGQSYFGSQFYHYSKIILRNNLEVYSLSNRIRVYAGGQNQSFDVGTWNFVIHYPMPDCTSIVAFCTDGYMREFVLKNNVLPVFYNYNPQVIDHNVQSVGGMSWEYTASTYAIPTHPSTIGYGLSYKDILPCRPNVLLTNVNHCLIAMK